MGERWLCKPEVVGSIPISSTNGFPWALGATEWQEALPLFIDN